MKVKDYDAQNKDKKNFFSVAGSKWALLIANTDYNIDPLPPLFTPASDMEKLAKELSEMNFHCLMLTNLNLIELKNSVKFFSSLIKPGDYGKKNFFFITIKYGGSLLAVYVPYLFYVLFF